MVVKSKTVLKCIESLNLSGINKEITIKWVKAHNNHCGNEYADMLAKTGTTNSDNKVEVPLPISYAKHKGHMNL